MTAKSPDHEWWLKTYELPERRKVAYAIAHRETEDQWELAKIANPIMSGAETPMDHGWTRTEIAEFFTAELMRRARENLR